MAKGFGRVTVPTEEGFEKETLEIMQRWGADAVRDSDGTHLDGSFRAPGAKLYTTYFVSRGHNAFASQHLEERQRIYLMSERALCTGSDVSIPIMNGYFAEQIAPDYDCDVSRYWEVRDRTDGRVVPACDWSVNRAEQTVTVQNAQPFHEYTVSFLAVLKWDCTQMYNYITNDWQGKERDIPFDIRHPASWAYAKEALKCFLEHNPDMDVVRFTTFFYHFTLVFNEQAKEKYVDWFGYSIGVSVEALQAFEKEYGYALTPEDFVDEGYYHASFRVPNKRYRDYMDFIGRFVSERARQLVDITHEAGREAMMFLGDNWIGTEPYGPYWKSVGVDAVVGSVGNGTTLRMISEIPDVKYTEGRFLPYFFPDTFYEGNDPCKEAVDNWLCARRAIMRKPVDRIGYGGYLSLAYRFESFVECVGKIADEFREIYDRIHGHAPYTALTVGVLNCWGALRSWQTHMVAHAIPYKQTYSYAGVLEALSGMAVGVRFLSFEDIRDGVPQGIDVILNAGDEGTAFSGGEAWLDPQILSVLRKWVYQGGALIGVGDPSAVQENGRFFQLADVFGVDRERGFSLSSDKYCTTVTAPHFITEDAVQPMDFGESKKNVYALSENTQILEYSDGEVHLSANDFGAGRAVYIAGLPYSPENTRLLLRSLYYAAHKEDAFKRFYADRIGCEVHAYPSAGCYAVLNQTASEQCTTVYDGEGAAEQLVLPPSGIVWREM